MPELDEKFGPERVSDDDLMRMYRRGDADAFDVLFDRHYQQVYSVARTILGDRSGAEDVLQDAFLTVATEARKYEPRGRFRAWIMRIVRNRCLNRLAAERARRAVTGGGLEIIEPPARDPPPDELVQTDEQVAIVRAGIADLPERQREAMALYAFGQMHYREIAEVLDAPINTVKTLIHRARASLARSLESLNRE